MRIEQNRISCIQQKPMVEPRDPSEFGGGGRCSSSGSGGEYHKTMYPYKYEGHVTGQGASRDSFVHHPSPSENRRMSIDTMAFEKLVRRVDWLYEEVRYIRQSLETFQRKANTYEQHPLAYRHSYEDSWESKPPHYRSDIPPRTSAYYDHSQLVHNYPVSSYAKSLTEARRASCTSMPTSTCSTSNLLAARPSRTNSSPIKSDKENLQYEMDSPASNGLVRGNVEDKKTIDRIPDDLTIAEIIILWERGINDIPPVVEWNRKEKQAQQEKLEVFFKIYYVFKELCSRDITQFVSQYTDPTSKQMQTAQYVASRCPVVKEQFEEFMQSNIDNQKEELGQEKVFTLPRKINGRKVSAKDVIQLWEYGMGDVPPIKMWTKSQKFKQQSKISRWKKIVDIFKYQCISDMKKFEEIYSDGHGCLLPVAAITNKFETIYGDELNITSKLMTVATSENIRKRKLTDDSCSDEVDVQRERNEKEEYQSPLTSDNVRHDHFTPPPPLLMSLSSPPKLIKSEDDHLRASSEEELGNGYSNRLSTTKRPSERLTNKIYDENSPHSSNCESEEVSEDNSLTPNLRRLSSMIYILPDTFTLKEAISFWDKGSTEFPPVKTWTRTQNSLQLDLVLKLEKVYWIFTEKFHSDMTAFLSASLDDNNQEITIDRFLAKYQDTKVTRVSSASSMTFDFSHHKTVTQSKDSLYLLPRKINGRKVSAKDVLQLWYHGLNKIPPVKLWSPQQKAVQQSKISRWKKIVELFEQDFHADWESFQKHFSNGLGQLLPITAIISKHEEESRSMTESALPQHL